MWVTQSSDIISFLYGRHSASCCNRGEERRVPTPEELKNMMQKQMEIFALRSATRDFPGGPVVGTPPSNAGGAGSIPGRGVKIPHASQPKSQHIKQRQYCNKFNKDFKKGPHQKNS